MGLDDSHNHVLAPAVPSQSFTEHVVSLPNAGSITQKKLEHPFFFFIGRCLFQPLLRSLTHAAIVVEYFRIVELCVELRS
jgi:hypothetical protein